MKPYFGTGKLFEKHSTCVISRYQFLYQLSSFYCKKNIMRPYFRLNYPLLENLCVIRKLIISSISDWKICYLKVYFEILANINERSY